MLTADTGTSVGDVLNRIIILNKAVSPPSVVGAIWVNATTGLAIAAPTVGHFAEATRDIAIASQSAGLALDTSLQGLSANLGAQADAAATADAGSFSIVALLKRGLARWTTLLAAIGTSNSATSPGSAVQIGCVDGNGLFNPADTSANPWTVSIAGSVQLSNAGPAYAFGSAMAALDGSKYGYPNLYAAAAGNPGLTTGNASPGFITPDGMVVSGNGFQRALNISAATVVKTGACRIVRVSVITAGTSVGRIDDASATGASGTSTEVFVIPNTVGVYEVNFPLTAGLLVTPGSGGQVVAVSYN